MSLDVVYTWVDDAWPGYLAARNAHAATPDDTNPNRTRDNLELLRFSLRSLARHLPWVGRVWLVTQRPQVPAWLDDRRVRVVHHDDFMDRAHLPTWNSFAIVAQLFRIEGLGRRFLYVEDDRLFLRDVASSDLLDGDRPRVLVRRFSRDDSRRFPDKSPWNRAVANADRWLDSRYGATRRGSVNYAPPVFDREHFASFAGIFAEAWGETIRSRFRGPRDIAPEHMFPWFLLHEGLAVRGVRAHRQTAKWGLANAPRRLALALRVLGALRPRHLVLNDDFGERPDPRAEAVTRAWLTRTFPTPSPWEVA